MTQDYQRRKSPSGNKYQYLLHLEDTLDHVVKGTKAASMLIDEVMLAVSTRLPNKEQLIYILLDDLNRYKADFNDLVQALKERLVMTSDIRATMKDQMEYSNRLRNTMIGILVAIYVPLSFTTVS